VFGIVRGKLAEEWKISHPGLKDDTMSVVRFAKPALLLVLTATLAQAETPREKYMRLLKGLSDTGYTRDQVNAITLVATTMASVKVCPPEEGRTNGWVVFTINDAFRGFGCPKDELVSKAEELVPPLVEALVADPAEKANFCGPIVEEDKPKR
jgi:hypothetical protein